MKVRNSLVSNSSSASFVILWRSLQAEIYTKDEAINILTKDNAFLSKTDNVKELKERTQQFKNDIFETRFFTSMMNSISDFGDLNAHFMLQLSMSSHFEIIKTHIEE